MEANIKYELGNRTWNKKVIVDINVNKAICEIFYDTYAKRRMLIRDYVQL